MRSDDLVRLRHIIDEANEAIKFTEGFSFDDFVKDGKTVHAVVRAVEVLGEAAAKLSKEFKEAHSNIPWADIIGMRNHLIHVYFDIDYEAIWETIKSDLPMLIKIIEPLIKEK